MFLSIGQQMTAWKRWGRCKRKCSVLFCFFIQFYESNRRKTLPVSLNQHGDNTGQQALSSLCLYLLPHPHYHAIPSKRLIQTKYTLDSFFFFSFTVSHLEYILPNPSRVPKHCFAWKASHYLENPKYQSRLNTDINTVQLWTQSNFVLIPCCIF